MVAAFIHTDEGVSGLGYTLAFGGGGAEAMQVYLETRLKPLLIGEDPLMVEKHWERMYRADRGIKRQGIAAYTLSALDIGLWDIAEKVADLPCTSSGAGTRIAPRPTAAEVGASTRSRISSRRPRSTWGAAAATTR